jgi:hypothetical protein
MAGADATPGKPSAGKRWTSMDNVKKRGDFDRGPRFDDSDLKPLSIALAAIIAVWLVACLLVSVVQRSNAHIGNPPEVSSTITAPASP